MTWFLTREEAEALLATVDKQPNYTYAVEPNGCGPDGWGIMVLDEDGKLLTESYTPGDVFPLREEPKLTEAEYRELLKKGGKP